MTFGKIRKETQEESEIPLHVMEYWEFVAACQENGIKKRTAMTMALVLKAGKLMARTRTEMVTVSDDPAAPRPEEVIDFGS